LHEGEEAMKRSRFAEEQLLFALKQAEAGQAVSDVCRQMGASEATFYVWKKRYANLGVLFDQLLDRRFLRRTVIHRPTKNAYPTTQREAADAVPS
jgi:transposase-like protein